MGSACREPRESQPAAEGRRSGKADLTNTNNFITCSALPARPYDVAIGGGLAFVADGTYGLQIVNFAGFDTKGVAPNVAVALKAADLDPLKPGIQLQEGSHVDVQPTVSDGVQVRNVELRVGDTSVLNDVQFPFELGATLPTIVKSGGSTVTLQVRATDTGGNIGLSAPITVDLVPDTTPPTLLGSSISEGLVVGSNDRAVTLTFSEAIDTSSLLANTVQVIRPDGSVVNSSNVQARSNGRQLQFTFDKQVPGNYTLRVNTAGLQDCAGNAMAAGVLETHFTIKQFSNEWLATSGGDWNYASNWSTGVVPSATDDVYIGLVSGVVTISGGDVSVASLVVRGDLQLAGSTLTVANDSIVRGKFTQTAGVLSGAGTLAVQGR